MKVATNEREADPLRPSPVSREQTVACRKARLKRLAEGQPADDRDWHAPEDKSDESEAWEIGEDGKPRRKKAEEPEDENASSDDDQIPQPMPQSPPDRSIPSRTAWRLVPASIKISALQIVNCGRMRRGLPALTKLVQDEAITDVAQIPTSIEARARTVINCGRRSRGLAPIGDDDWISIESLRGK
jgi:hypothetical protein